MELTFNFQEQYFYSPSFEVGGSHHSWKLRRHYNSITLDLLSGGAVQKSVTVDLPEPPVPGVTPPSPLWDEEFDFTGEEPVDAEVRAWRVGSCNYITLRAVDPCVEEGGIHPIQTGNVTYSVYRESDKKFLTRATSDDDGKAMVFGLKEGEDYRVVAEKPGCGSGSSKIVDLEMSADYSVSLGCSASGVFTTRSHPNCWPNIGQIPGYEEFWWDTAIPGVTVVLTKGDEWIAVKTGADGKFRWTPSESGTWSATTSHPSGAFRTGPYNVVVDLCSAVGGTITMPPAPGYSCDASGVIRSPYPIKLPILCVTDKGASWTQGPTGTAGNSSTGGTFQPMESERMGPGTPNVLTCASWCTFNQEPDGLAAGMVNVRASVGLFSLVPTDHIPPASGSVTGSFAVRNQYIEWKQGLCSACVEPSPPHPRNWSAWHIESTEADLVGINSPHSRWELLSAKPFVARVYFEWPNTAYTGTLRFDGSDVEGPLPPIINHITVSEAG